MGQEEASMLGLRLNLLSLIEYRIIESQAEKMDNELEDWLVWGLTGILCRGWSASNMGMSGCIIEYTIVVNGC